MFLLNDISEAIEKQHKALTQKINQIKLSQSSIAEGDENLDYMSGADMEEATDLAQGSSSDLKNPLQTFVHSIFQGTLRNETKCLTCDTVTSRDEHFLDLPVDIEQNSSVSHCLRSISKVERLCGSNKFSCESCGSLQEAEKRTLIKKLPKILVLHLKRFKYFEKLQGYAKLSHRVTFPIELRVPSLVPDFGEEEANFGEVSPPMYFNDSPADQSYNSSIAEKTDPIYYLSAMVLHLGATAQSGHYIAFIRSGDKWLQMDDHKVEPVQNIEPIMNSAYACWNHNPEEPQNSASAYILFYERKS